MNPVEYLTYRARTHGDSVALYIGDQVLTFEALRQAVARRAREIAHLKPTQQTIVGIEVAHPVEQWVTILACFHLGLCSTSHPILSSLPMEFWPSLWVADQSLPGVPDQSQLLLSRANLQSEDLPPPANVAPTKLARIFFTSGTTGQSKSVAVSFGTQHLRSLMRSANGIQTASAVLMMPVDSAAGLLQALHFLSLGRPVALGPDAASLINLVKKYRLEAVYASPHQFGQVLKWLRDNGQTLALKYLYLTGSGISRRTFDDIRTFVNGAEVFSICGATEVGFLTVKQIHTQADLGYWGVTGPGVIIELVDEKGELVDEGDVGVIRIKTPYMAASYLDTGREIDGQWFYPGDLGQFDKKGELVFSGRSDEVFNLDGIKVSLLKVDNFLVSHPGVVDAAAFVVEGQAGLRHLWAAVQLEPGTTLDQLYQKAKITLDRSHLPERILPVAFVPRTFTGKPQRQLMAAKVTQLFSAELS